MFHLLLLSKEHCYDNIYPNTITIHCIIYSHMWQWAYIITRYSKHIPDCTDENDQQCKVAVHKFFQNQLKLAPEHANNIQFIRCHRLGAFKAASHRSVIARFCNFKDRQSVWLSCKHLPDQPYTMSEDFPRRIAFRRRLLYPIFREARKPGRYISPCLFVWMNCTSTSRGIP